MKDNSKLNLEELLQSKFEHHEVNADHVWNNLAKQLPASPSPGWSVYSKLAAAVVGATAVSAVTYFMLNDNSSSMPVSQQKTELQQEEKRTSANTIDTLTQSIQHSTNNDFTNHVSEQEARATHSNELENSSFVFQEGELHLSDEMEDFIHFNSRNNENQQVVENREAIVQSSHQDVELTSHFTCVPTNQNELRYFLFAAQDGADQYHWSVSNGFESHDQAVAIQFNEEGEYEISLMVEVLGESKTESQIVKVFKPAQLNTVNAFAPGIDGKNDSFDVLEGSMNINSFSNFTITSSTGKVVFESTHSSVWDGKLNNELQQPGSYFWFLEYQDKEGATHQAKGKIQLFAE
jgi:hypothetical protein